MVYVVCCQTGARDQQLKQRGLDDRANRSLELSAVERLHWCSRPGRFLDDSDSRRSPAVVMHRERRHTVSRSERSSLALICACLRAPRWAIPSTAWSRPVLRAMPRAVSRCCSLRRRAAGDLPASAHGRTVRPTARPSAASGRAFGPLHRRPWFACLRCGRASPHTARDRVRGAGSPSDRPRGRARAGASDGHAWSRAICS